jgi:hypothetical protein
MAWFGLFGNAAPVANKVNNAAPKVNNATPKVNNAAAAAAEPKVNVVTPLPAAVGGRRKSKKNTRKASRKTSRKNRK